MVRADFLERVRRYSFLLTLGFSLYLGYGVYAGQINLRVNEYRGIENSAWLGTVIALVASMFLTLVGFYIVKNSIQRDRQTRVGQVLATTPISKSFYTLGKALSNFAVLAAMVLVLALAAFAIQLLRHEDLHVHLVALLAPLLVLGLTAVAITAALAVLFESLPILRGGVGNVLYFFLWIAMISAGVATVANGAPSKPGHWFVDFTGAGSVMGQVQDEVRRLDSSYKGGIVFSVGPQAPATRTFLWTGLKWPAQLVESRLILLAVAALLALLAALFFDRFDPERSGWVPPGGWLDASQRKRAAKFGVGGASAVHAGLQAAPELSEPRCVIAHLTAAPRTPSHTRFIPLVVAELRLLLHGHGWWWYAGAAGLLIAGVASPIDAARSGVLPAAWLWPVLLWSQLGTREAQWSTGALIFSAPRAVPRQLLASYAAGVVVALLTGGGLALHLLYLHDFAGLGAWAAGALFIPALALALGVCSGSRKFFEALYTVWWYIGPLHHIRQLDFMGTTPASSTSGGYLAASVLLLIAAYAWRKVRVVKA